MARVTPEEYAEKHARRLKAATEDIRRGIGNTTTAPGEAAVRKQDKMLNNLTMSITDGTWARRTRGVSLAEWQRAAIEKGVNRIAAGIDAVRDKQVVMAGKLLRAVDAAANKVKAMPDETLEDSIARMSSFVRDMAAAKIKD